MGLQQQAAQALQLPQLHLHGPNWVSTHQGQLRLTPHTLSMLLQAVGCTKRNP